MSKFTLIALAVTHVACMPEPPELGGPPAAGSAGAPGGDPTDPSAGAEALPALGHRAVTDEAKRIHADLDVDGSGAVSLDEFAAAVDLDDAAAVFASADPDADGAVTMIELLRAVGEWTWHDRR